MSTDSPTIIHDLTQEFHDSEIQSQTNLLLMYFAESTNMRLEMGAYKEMEESKLTLKILMRTYHFWIF